MRERGVTRIRSCCPGGRTKLSVRIFVVLVASGAPWPWRETRRGVPGVTGKEAPSLLLLPPCGSCGVRGRYTRGSNGPFHRESCPRPGKRRPARKYCTSVSFRCRVRALSWSPALSPAVALAHLYLLAKPFAFCPSCARRSLPRQDAYTVCTGLGGAPQVRSRALSVPSRALGCP